MDVLQDVHLGLPVPEKGGNLTMVKGSYLYYHYSCDGTQDQGWGCGYRTLQTLCSHLRIAKELAGKTCRSDEPTLRQIQEALVTMHDKSENFLGSKDWIGSVEVALCLDFFHDVAGKILHVKSGDELKSLVPDLLNHFETKGTPVMMGGDTDASSKGILGVCVGSEATYLLVLDPHFVGEASMEELVQKKWVSWKRVDSFETSSFYNMCLPQYVSDG
ncbi:ufm1-specific protease 1-like isoform X1 [Diadema setosum]|uniref:ufm1-specific protease 1-like isoform X1 n=1 Tax=Diadema setosum TaxID=31175 RepID=UPI003B3BA535